MRKIRLLYLLPIAAMVFAGCEKKNKNKNNEPDQQQPSGDQGGDQGGEQGGEGGEQQQQPVDFVGLTLNDATVTFDGQPHTISVAGDLPEGAQVSYGEAGNSFTAVGDHEVTATITCEGYNTLVLHGTLHIVAADFTGLTFADSTVTYDGQPHSIVISGELPEGATVDYGAGNSFTEAGDHEVTATVSCAGYTDLVLHATLHIVKAQFQGLSLANATVDYNGAKQTIELTGDLPAGATFTYDNGHDGATNVGEYVVSGTVSAEGYEDLHLEATLTIVAPVASDAYLVTDFENLTDNDLADDFTFEYFNGGWVTPSTATIALAKNEIIGNGEQTLRMNMSHQGNAFKVTKHFDNVNRKYGGIALDTLVDNYAAGAQTKIQVQIWYDNLPLPDILSGYRRSYVTWTLDNNCPTNWTHWEIPFTDSTISINGGAITVDQLSQFGLTIADMSQYIDDVAVLVTPNGLDGGPKSYAYIDNIELIPESPRSKEQFFPTGAKDYTIASNDGTVFSLYLGGSNQARFSTLNLETNIILEGTYTRSEDAITLRVAADLDHYEDTEIIFPLRFSKNGTVLEFTGSPSGAGAALLAPYAAHTDFDGKVFNQVITIDNFEDYSATGQGYDRGHRDISAVSGLRAAYYGEVYNENKPAPGIIEDKWSLINDGSWTTYINLETSGAFSGSKAMSLTNNADWQTRYMTFDLARGGAQPYGRGSTFSFFVKGSVAQTMKIRIYYVDRITAANQGSTSGDCKYVEGINVTTDWTHIEVPLEANRQVYGFMITPVKKNARLWIDDVMMYGEGSPFAVYEGPSYPTINDGLYGVKVDDHFYSVNFANDVTTATVAIDGSGFAVNFTAEMDEGQVTIKDADGTGAGLTVVFNIVDGALEVVSASGTYASQFAALAGATLVKVANLNYNFDGKTAGSPLSDSDWLQQYKSGANWVDMSGQINVRKGSIDNNIFGNFTCGNNNTEYAYTYQPAGGLGLANSFSVCFTNDYDGAVDISVKISLILADSSEVYIYGDADTFEVVPAGTGNRNNGGWLGVDETFAAASVAAIKFVVKSGKASGQYGYLYFDNLNLSYDLNVAPTPVYANISYDLQDKTAQVGSPLNDAQWTQKRYENSGWKDLSSSMNVRNSGDNVFCNMAVGYSMDYVFTFTPTSGAGLANHFSVDLANDFSGAQDIKVKVKVILADASEVFIVGDGSNYVTVPANAPKWQNFETSFTEAEVVGVKFIVKSAMNGTAYLYFDNLLVNHVAP